MGTELAPFLGSNEKRPYIIKNNPAKIPIYLITSRIKNLFAIKLLIIFFKTWQELSFLGIVGIL